jgi:hypothetical protein
MFEAFPDSLTVTPLKDPRLSQGRYEVRVRRRVMHETENFGCMFRNIGQPQDSNMVAVDNFASLTARWIIAHRVFQDRSRLRGKSNRRRDSEDNGSPSGTTSVNAACRPPTSRRTTLSNRRRIFAALICSTISRSMIGGSLLQVGGCSSREITCMTPCLRNREKASKP